MSGRHLLPHLLAVALIGGFCLPASAADDYTPRPQRIFIEKPRIEDYADYNAFLVDIMEYRRQKQERQQAKAAETAATTAVAPSLMDETLAKVSGQQAVDLRELYLVREPESLEEALERARKLPHPVYEEAERFGRTTSFSFPMPQMEVDDMSTREISGLLQDMESVNPEIFRDDSDQGQADRTLSKNANNDDDAREIKAIDSTRALFRPFFEIASRMITDAEGNQILVPEYIKTEIGYTVIRQLDIDVVIKTD